MDLTKALDHHRAYDYIPSDGHFSEEMDTVRLTACAT